jgi:ParB family chromosome partitioning protein
MSNDLKKRGLGRGLGALIMNTTGAPPGDSASIETGSVRHLRIDDLSPNPQQPRTHFDAATLIELADSIRAHGIIQPLVVTVVPDQPDLYWIVAGERRWRAARLAGLVAVPAIVREASPQQLMEWALVENVQRDDLNPLEEAAAFRTLLVDFGLTQAEVAARVGKSRSAVANTVRLLNLPPDAQQALVDERISAGHARALLSLPEVAVTQAALAEILVHDLSVRQTEVLVKQLLEAPPPPIAKPAIDPHLQAHLNHLEDRFRSALSTRVSLNRNDDGSGRLVVHFYSDDDLDAIYRLITGVDE